MLVFAASVVPMNPGRLFLRLRRDVWYIRCTAAINKELGKKTEPWVRGDTTTNLHTFL
jgi:hypothetical protein